MTREEAVKILSEQQREFNDNYIDYGRVNEAYDTAIEALEYELCEDCISRKATIHALGEVHPLDYNAQAIKTRIEQLPSAQLIRAKGKWIDIGSGTECSMCHEIQHGYDNYRFFCPNCGADMRG